MGCLVSKSLDTTKNLIDDNTKIKEELRETITRQNTERYKLKALYIMFKEEIRKDKPNGKIQKIIRDTEEELFTKITR